MSCSHVETLEWRSPNGRVLATVRYHRNSGFCSACGVRLDNTDACSCGHTASFHGDQFSPKPCLSVLCDCETFDGQWGDLYGH